MTSKPFEHRESGSIDFDPIVPEASTAPEPSKVDDKMDTDPLSITFGRPKDSRPNAVDRMLAGATIDWLIAFPADLRPKALCDGFPHVANRLASDWSSPARSAHSLRALAADPRWGSAGYPAKVQGEVTRLLQELPEPPELP